MYTVYYEHFSNEVYQATACYVIWKNLQNRPAEDPEILKCMNRNPLSWIFIRHSMMVSLIMTLGRIFDTDGDAISVDDLINSCISDIHLFSKSCLRERKLKEHNAIDWIDDYMESIYEPTAIDFQKLKPCIRNHRDVFNKFYKPIRHKIFAHTDRKIVQQVDDLWRETKSANMEDMLSFLEDLKSTVQQAYLNGRRPVLSGKKFDEKWFESDIQGLLDRVKSSSCS